MITDTPFRWVWLFAILLLSLLFCLTSRLYAEAPKQFSLIFSQADSAKMIGDYQKAIDLYETLISPENEAEFPEPTGKIHLSCGRVYEALGDFDVAYDHYDRARALFEQTGYFNGLALTYNTMGYYQQFQGEPDKALSLYEKSLRVSKKHNVLMFIGINYSSIGSIYCLELGELEKGRIYLDSSLVANQKIGYTEGLSIAYNELGQSFVMEVRYPEALKNFKKSYLYGKEMKDFHSDLVSINNIGECYVRLENQDSAQVYLNKGLALGLALGAKDDIRIAYGGLAESYAAQGKFKPAYEAHVKFMSYNDSVYNDDKLARISDLQVKYEAELKDREILLLTQRSKIETLQNDKLIGEKQQRIRVLGTGLLIVGLLLALGIVLFLRYRSRQRAERLAAELGSSRKLRDADREIFQLEIKAVKAQLNPHFMFNALNSIQEFILSNDKIAATTHLGNFSELMRKVLQHSEDHWVSLEDEIEILSHYLELEGLRFGTEFTYEIELDPTIDPENLMIPSLLMQPLVENALKHGLAPKPGEKRVVIKIQASEEDTLKLQIIDNGIGRKAASERKKAGFTTGMSFGMAAIKKRLSLLNEQRKTSGQLWVEDLFSDGNQAVGTRVMLTLPIMNEFEAKHNKEAAF